MRAEVLSFLCRVPSLPERGRGRKYRARRLPGVGVGGHQQLVRCLWIGAYGIERD